MKDLLNERIAEFVRDHWQLRDNVFELRLRELIADCCQSQQCSGCREPIEHERYMRQRFAPEPRMTWLVEGRPLRTEAT